MADVTLCQNNLYGKLGLVQECLNDKKMRDVASINSVKI